jgi:flagellar hook protein FlgE
MMRGMFAAISGLKTHQTMLDVTANDIANVNTVGYKASRTTFADALSQLQRGGTAPSAGSGGSNSAQIGLGVNVGSIDNMMGSGAFQSTGSVLDVAIQGKGFFRVGASPTPPPGVTVPTQFQYTRGGNLAVNTNGYLTTQDGFYVVGRTAAGGGVDTLLNVPVGASDAAIGSDGAVSYTPAGGGARVTAGYLSLATFPNEAGLERISGTRWRESASSGNAAANTPGVAGNGLTISGVLEMSNVDLASEFTEMISAQRGFQANSRVISASDQMLQDLVQLGR